MEKQLKSIEASYDKAIEAGRKGIDLYKNLPEHITSDPDYSIFQSWITDNANQGSGCPQILDYLSPGSNMNFIDLGCCLNLMFRGYDQWPSVYHGVDISSETIRLLSELTEKREWQIGTLYCGSVHQTPFETGYFDIGACIGVLEYFEKDFVTQAIIEAHRIIKPYGKFVLDIPDIENPNCRIMKLIEEHLERPCKFNMTSQEFEDAMQKYFKIERIVKSDVEPMVLYFLSCKK